MKWLAIRLLPLLIVFFIALYFIQRYPSPLKESHPYPTQPPHSVGRSPEPDSSVEDLKKQLDEQLAGSYESNTLLTVPKKKPPKKTKPRRLKPPPQDKRAQGRKEREKLPLGVVLWDRVKVYTGDEKYKILYQMQTGDFVRVFPDPSTNDRKKIQPGVDLYLAQTSKKFEAAGNRLPDQAGWVDASNLQIFEPEQAIQFTQQSEPMTLGLDPDFSTLSFYERALENPDPVVHRVVGPRFIELLSIHEDYVTSWRRLYRDPDSKIRSVTLSALKERGVGQNRPLLEDLIRRLSELTRLRAQGEEEIEVLTILKILEESGQDRVPVALASFEETWRSTQSERINQAVQKILR